MRQDFDMLPRDPTDVIAGAADAGCARLFGLRSITGFEIAWELVHWNVMPD